MATVYGSYISSAFRSRADISTSQTNTDFTISVTGYCQMADYYHDSGENFFRKIVIGADTPNTYVTASTAYFSGGGTYGVGSSSRKYKRTHSAQSIEVGVAIHNDGVYTGWSTADSYARTTVTVPAKPSYAVTYNANGGSSTPSSQTQWYGESVTLAGAITRANASATGYKVTYNANGGSCSTTSATAARTTKYTFSKWNTKSDGSGTAYSAGTAYTPNAALALYATWTSSTTTSAVTLPTPTRSGYTFNGWYNGSTKAGNAGASFTPNGNVTLTASWTQNTWTVSYAANGGSSTPSSQTKKSGTALKLASAIGHANATATITTTFNANGGSATGATNNRLTSTKTTSYAFTKWKATNGTLYDAGGSYTTDAATTMTAQWSSSNSYTAITLPTPTRTGYTFNGWYTAASGGSKAGNAGASHKPTADATLYAHWTIITHTVTLDPQGGSVSPASLTKTYGTALTLPTPYRSGYTFLGWNTAAAGTGTHYGTGSGGYTYDGGDRKLYAQWIGVSVSSFSVRRSDSAGTAQDDGTYARATANWSAGCTGTSNVTKTLTVKYLSGSTETTAGTTSTTGSYGITVGSGSTFAADTSYRFTATATVTWTYNGSSRSVSATRVTTIPKVFRLLDALHGGTGLAIGAIATLANTFEVALTTLFQNVVEVAQGNITRDGTYTEPANGDHQIRFVDGSRRILSYLSAHKTANSPNNYLRLTAYGPSGSKTANVYLSASDTDGIISTDCDLGTSLTQNASGRGYFLKDSAGNDYPGVYDNGLNLWIGSTQAASTHHTGQTVISTGHNGTSGNPTILVCVPNAANDGGTSYGVYHEGHKPTPADIGAVSTTTYNTVTLDSTGTGVVTAKSNFSVYTAGNLNRAYKRNGVATVYLGFKTTNALTAGGSYNIGTLNSGWRPNGMAGLWASGTRYGINASTQANGEIYMTPTVAIPAGTVFYLGGTFVQA